MIIATDKYEIVSTCLMCVFLYNAYSVGIGGTEPNPKKRRIYEADS